MGLGFRVQGQRFRVKYDGLGFRFQRPESRVEDLGYITRGFRVSGLGFRVQGSGFRVKGSGFRV